MSCFKVKVKWGKEMFKDVELDTRETPDLFRAQVFTLTGVSTEKMKLLIKGTTIKPDSWEGTEGKLKDGVLIGVIGNRDEDALREPTEKTTFVEDMSAEETNVALANPVGIQNLGNTCYLNAVIQCMKTVPEINTAIRNYAPKFDAPTTNKSQSVVVTALRTTYDLMESGNTAVPLLLVESFRSLYPRFAEQSSQGGYMQQDANECWTELRRLLQDTLPPDDMSKTKQEFRSTLIEKYMSGAFECVWTCAEDNAEPPSTTVSPFHQLSCHISTDVKYLQTGMLARLTESLTKHSPILNRDALFTKKSLISRLPAYLTIDMVRFFYKEKEAVNAKILKDVKFTLVLDVMELCTPELKKKLTPYREYYKDMEDREKDVARTQKTGRKADLEPVKEVPYYFEDDVGSCNSGFYQLQAVLTHQGRTSSSGHYVAWIRFRDHWIMCDDDEITSVNDEEIMKLSGGGDWHCAYVLLYGPRPLSVPMNVNITPYSEEMET